MRYYEDFSAGERFTFEPVTFTRDEIVAVAEKYDPQAFHLSEEGGAATHYGGLIASGWHTTGLVIRSYVTGLLLDTNCLGSPGFDEVRFPRPVRPGDVLTPSATVENVTDHKRRPDWGNVHLLIEAANQNGEPAFMMRTRIIVGRREARP